jgi:hypothetical protein
MKVLYLLFVFICCFSYSQERRTDDFLLYKNIDSLITYKQYDNALKDIKIIEIRRDNSTCGNEYYMYDRRIAYYYKLVYGNQNKFKEGIIKLDECMSNLFLDFYQDVKLIQIYKGELLNKLYSTSLKIEIETTLKSNTIFDYKVSENKKYLLIKLYLKDNYLLDLYYEIKKKKINNKKQAIFYALKNLDNQDLFKNQ